MAAAWSSGCSGCQPSNHFKTTMKQTPEPRRTKGSENWIIERAIADGLRFENGSFILPSGRTATLRTTKAGYRVIALGPESHRRSFTVARILCWIFFGPPPTPSHQADHINRNRSDDRVENLRWASPRVNALNISEASKARLSASCQRPRRRRFGEEHHAARLSIACVEAIKLGVGTQRCVARAYSVSQSHVSRIRSGKAWASALSKPKEDTP